MRAAGTVIPKGRYQAKGYSSNFLYARVIEAELNKRGKLTELQAATEHLAKKPWADIQKNLTFFANALYQAACEVAGDAFKTPEEVRRAITEAGQGEQYNVQFLVRTLLEEVETRQKQTGKPCRLIFVLDESGQWIEDSQERLSALQALVEEAADKGQGKIWIFVTTHEDMGAIASAGAPLRTVFRSPQSVCVDPTPAGKRGGFGSPVASDSVR